MSVATYKIVTFGCQANQADSERLEAYYQAQGLTQADSLSQADQVVINTCMVRQMAEDRVYGLYQNLIKQKQETGKPERIIVTGCMVGAALREKSGKYFQLIRQRMPQVDEFLPIEEVGFEFQPVRTNQHHAWVPISNGCNNFCTFCIVPFSRGREISRPFEQIVQECQHLADQGYRAVTLVGQNVNSYGADLLLGADNVQAMRDVTDKVYFDQSTQQVDKFVLPGGKRVKPTWVKHLGRQRIPTLFPQLLEYLCQHFDQFEQIEFISSNPWDFSDDLIQVMAKYPQISRRLHLPVQSGSDRILQKMNRWYTAEQYLQLVQKIKQAVPEIELTTDIIVGFPSETEAEFEQTVQLAQKVGFAKAYIAYYSARPGTAATKAFADDVPYEVKKRRWHKLNQLINET